MANILGVEEVPPPAADKFVALVGRYARTAAVSSRPCRIPQSIGWRSTLKEERQGLAWLPCALRWLGAEQPFR